MNIEEYISSGIIETYVLGLAEQEDVRKLEELCLEFPEIQEAVMEVEASMENYALLHAINPPDKAKDQIWDAILQETDKVKPIKKAKKKSAKTRSNMTVNSYKYLARAAVFLILIGLPYHLYKMREYTSEISELQREKTEILAQNELFAEQIQQVSQEVEIFSDPSIRSVILAGVEGHEDQSARVYWSDAGEVYLTASGLPALSSDQQYQLWAIVDGQPVNVGLLEQGDTSRLQKMAVIDRAEMFAITIEKQGGSEQPTLEQMVVAGKEVS